MSKYIISERQYEKLTETGSNSAAMDLDRYVQPVNYDTGTGNEDLVDTLDDVINKLEEIKSSLETGKKIEHSMKDRIFEISDLINDTCERINISKFTNTNN